MIIMVRVFLLTPFEVWLGLVEMGLVIDQILKSEKKERVSLFSSSFSFSSVHFQDQVSVVTLAILFLALALYL